MQMHRILKFRMVIIKRIQIPTISWIPNKTISELSDNENAKSKSCKRIERRYNCHGGYF